MAVPAASAFMTTSTNGPVTSQLNAANTGVNMYVNQWDCFDGILGLWFIWFMISMIMNDDIIITQYDTTMGKKTGSFVFVAHFYSFCFVCNNLFRRNGWVADSSKFAYGLPGSIQPYPDFDPFGFAEDADVALIKQYREVRCSEAIHHRTLHGRTIRGIVSFSIVSSVRFLCFFFFLILFLY